MLLRSDLSINIHFNGKCFSFNQSGTLANDINFQVYLLDGLFRWNQDREAAAVGTETREHRPRTYSGPPWGTFLWGLPTTRDIYRWLSDSDFDKPGPKKRGVYCFTLVVSIRMSICNTFLSNFKSEVLIHVQNELYFWPHLMLPSSSISKLLILLFIHIKAGVSLVSMSHIYVVNSVDFSN